MISDYRTVPQKPITYPPAGEWFTDAFGAEVLRVTDERDGKRCTNAYSYWPALNCKSTWLLIACDDVPTLVHWEDGPLGSRNLCQTGDPPLQFEGATWSTTEPDVLKALGRDGKLYRYNVSRPPGKRATVVMDLQKVIYNPHHLTVSRGGTVYAFLGKKDSDPLQYAAVWAASDDAMFVWEGPGPVNEIQMAKSGTRAVVHLADGRAFLWAFRLDTYCELPNPTSHWDNGMTLMANGDGQETGIQVRPYPTIGKLTPAAPRNVMRYLLSDGKTPNWTVAEHVSLSQDEKTVLVSTYGKTTGRPFEHELILVKTDGSGFHRLAHTHSAYFARSGASKGLRYYDEPHAVLSMDGRWAVWTANLGDPKRWDVFAMRLP